LENPEDARIPREKAELSCNGGAAAARKPDLPEAEGMCPLPKAFSREMTGSTRRRSRSPGFGGNYRGPHRLRIAANGIFLAPAPLSQVQKRFAAPQVRPPGFEALFRRQSFFRLPGDAVAPLHLG
jgi:hypothetical protein